MKKFMTKNFSKWALKQNLENQDLFLTISEIENEQYEVNLGGGLYKKRIGFKGQGKSSSGRTIICYKKEDKAIFIHGFAKNEKSNLTKKELMAFKDVSKFLLGLNLEQIKEAIETGKLIEVVL